MTHLTSIISGFIVTALLSGCGRSDADQTSGTYPRPTKNASSTNENTSDDKNREDNFGQESDNNHSQIDDTEEDNLSDDIINSGVDEPTLPVPTTSSGVWKGILMTGDDSINAFDNARIKLKSLFTGFGIKAENLKELSMAPGMQNSSVTASSRANFEQTLSGLNLGPNDKCLIFLTSHGSRQGFYLKNQNTYDPASFHAAVSAACGSRKTVVLVSACYSGVFNNNPAWQKENMVIMTAASPTNTSFGCGAENQYTFWDNCLIDNLPTAQSWSGFSDTVKSCISQKESGGSFTPSGPTSFIGSQMQNAGMFR